jgi:hypothetical protein
MIIPRFAVIVGAALFGAALVSATLPADVSGKGRSDAVSPVAAAGTKRPDARTPDEPPREADPSRTINLYGTVFGPEDRPVAGARLYLSVDEWSAPIELGTTGDDGSYCFEVSEKKLRRTVGHSVTLFHQKASLIAVAEGLGPAWVVLPSVEGGRMGEMQHQYDRDFRLVADFPIAGRVVDIEGQPVAGAVVSVGGIQELSDPAWHKMHLAIESGDPDLMTRKEIDVNN